MSSEAASTVRLGHLTCTVIRSVDDAGCRSEQNSGAMIDPAKQTTLTSASGAKGTRPTILTQPGLVDRCDNVPNLPLRLPMTCHLCVNQLVKSLPNGHTSCIIIA